MPNGVDATHKHTCEAYLDEDEVFDSEMPLDNGKEIT